MTRKPSPLPDAERDVLACLNQLGEATVAEIQEKLSKKRPMSCGSAATLLKRLQRKKLVGRSAQRHGKSFLYRTLPKSESSLRHLVGELVDRVFHGDGAALVASLFESKPPSEEDIRKIRRILREHQSKTSKKQDR